MAPIEYTTKVRVRLSRRLTRQEAIRYCQRLAAEADLYLADGCGIEIIGDPDAFISRAEPAPAKKTRA